MFRFKINLLNTFFILFLLLFSFSTYANESNQMLYKKAKSLSVKHPEEARKIAVVCLNNSTSVQDEFESNFIIAQTYLNQGYYEDAMKYAFESGKSEALLSDQNKFDLYLLKSDIIRIIGLYDFANQYLDLAFAMHFDSSNALGQRNELERQMHKFILLIKEKKFSDADVLLLKLESPTYKKSRTENPDLDAIFILYTYELWIHKSNFTAADKALNEVIDLCKKLPEINAYYIALSYIYKGDLAFLSKDYTVSDEFLITALAQNKILNNVKINQQIYSKLSRNALAQHHKANYASYTLQMAKYDKLIDTIEVKAHNTIFSLIQSELDAKVDIQKNIYQIYVVVAIGSLLILILFLSFFVFRSKMVLEHKQALARFKEFNAKREIQTVVEPYEVAVVKDQTTKQIVPEETELAILNKLKKFESSNKFLNSEMSLAFLATLMDTNTKYLSEVINKHYVVNYNLYINRLRINYLIDKLRTDPKYLTYKISYLAELCGYASHSSFATIFKQITGNSPAVFIELLRKEIESKAAVTHED